MGELENSLRVDWDSITERLGAATCENAEYTEANKRIGTIQKKLMSLLSLSEKTLVNELEEAAAVSEAAYSEAAYELGLHDGLNLCRAVLWGADAGCR